MADVVQFLSEIFDVHSELLVSPLSLHYFSVKSHCVTHCVKLYSTILLKTNEV